MTESIIDFLKAKYGKRIDHAQPLIFTDNETIQKQLDLVTKRITHTKYIGILWTILGLLWLMSSTVSFVTESMDAGNIFKVALGVVYVISGFVYLIQGSDLRMKKVVLETILFINKTKS